ncbi:hypothetical protein Tco_0698946 [Tanacetum coccineum]
MDHDRNDEEPSAGSDQGLKKRKTSKDGEPTKCPKTKESKYGSSKGTKSQSKYSGKSVQAEEPEFEVADSDMPQDHEENMEPTDPDWNVGKTQLQGPTQSCLKITNLTQETLLGPAFKLLKGTRTNFAELEYDFEECYKALSEKLDWDSPEDGDYPFDLTKPLPLVMNGNRQMVPVDYLFNNDLKYLQGGISTMTYTTSTTKTKDAQYDLQGIQDIVPNIWSHVKVSYDRYALWGISHWRQQRKNFYAYTRGFESSHDVYSTERILAVTRVKVMRKHGYGYLREIEVRRADNDVYTFKEGGLPRLRINDIKDMLILIVQNKLTNLSGDDVFDFAITLPETTRPNIKKKDPYTPYQDPQGFIYVDNQGRNRLMHSDELYKFSDGTLTRLRTSLDDITKNIIIKYLPQRRWSSLEKKIAHIMIKAIDNQLKERRMMRSFEKFIGGRNYEADLRLLQRTI